MTAVLYYRWLAAAGLHDKIILHGVGGHRVYVGIRHLLLNVCNQYILVTDIYTYDFLYFAVTVLGPLVEPMVWAYRSDLTGYFPPGRVLLFVFKIFYICYDSLLFLLLLLTIMPLNEDE